MYLCTLLDLAHQAVQQDACRTSAEPCSRPAAAPPGWWQEIHLDHISHKSDTTYDAALDMFPCHNDYLFQDILVTAEDCEEDSKVWLRTDADALLSTRWKLVRLTRGFSFYQIKLTSGGSFFQIHLLKYFIRCIC